MKLSDDPSIRYHAIINDLPCGPFTFEGLESLLYLEKITAETLIRREGAADFSPIKATEIGGILFPPTPAKNTPQHWPAPGQANKPIAGKRKHYRLTKAKFEKLNRDPGDEPRLAVVDMLDQIRQAEIDAGHDHARRPRRFRLSKRSLDFWLTLIAGNTLLLGGGFLFKNVISLMFGIGGSALFTFGLLWTMYGIMDDY